MTTAIVERTITAFLDGEDSLEINNIIHSTAGAARFGYSGPLVGGTTVYSWSAAALVEALGDAWLDEGWVEFQLRKPVYPGEVITTRVDIPPPVPRGGDAESSHSLPPLGGDAEGRGGPPAVEFTMTKQTGDIAVRGTAGLGIANFLTEITTAADRTPVPQPEDRPFITRALAPLGEDLPAMAIELSSVNAEIYADEKASDLNPRWRGADGRVHPGWIAQRANALLAHTWRYTAIHASSQIQHLAPVHPDQRLLVSGRLASGYERKGHEYAVIDLTITSEDGRDLVRMRQPTIYQVAAR
ncbi:MAG: hypothetical protein OXH38_02305 [Chloroflexi bacterium]|nr:hypothetical protein [Chloroflexota bacterium]